MTPTNSTPRRSRRLKVAAFAAATSIALVGGISSAIAAPSLPTGVTATIEVGGTAVTTVQPNQTLTVGVTGANSGGWKAVTSAHVTHCGALLNDTVLPTWYINGGEAAQGDSFLVPGTVVNGDRITVTAYFAHDNSCKRADFAVAATDPVTVTGATNPQPADRVNSPMNVSITPADPGAGETITASATCPAGNAPEFQWYFNGTAQGPHSTANTIAAPAVGTDVWAEVICPAVTGWTEDTVTTTTDTVTVVANPSPRPNTATVTIDNEHPYPGDVLTATGTCASGATPTYQWRVAGADVAAPAGTARTFTVPATGAFGSLITVEATCPQVTGYSGDSATALAGTVRLDNTPATVGITDVTPVVPGGPVTGSTSGCPSGDDPVFHWFLNATTGATSVDLGTTTLDTVSSGVYISKPITVPNNTTASDKLIVVAECPQTANYAAGSRASLPADVVPLGSITVHAGEGIIGDRTAGSTLKWCPTALAVNTATPPVSVNPQPTITRTITWTLGTNAPLERPVDDQGCSTFVIPAGTAAGTQISATIVATAVGYTQGSLTTDAITVTATDPGTHGVNNVLNLEIAGNPVRGQTLTASATCQAGNTPTFQWFLGNTAVAGANTATLTVPAMANQTIGDTPGDSYTVRATCAATAGLTEGTATKTVVIRVANQDLPTIGGGRVVITGTPNPGQTLTATTSDWRDAAGNSLTPDSVVCTWTITRPDNTVLGTHTGGTFQIPANAPVNSRVSVQCIANKAGFNSSNAVTAQVAVLATTGGGGETSRHPATGVETITLLLALGLVVAGLVTLRGPRRRVATPA